MINNEKQTDLLVTAINKGTKKLEKCLDQHLGRVLEVRKDIAVKNSSLVTDELTKHIPALRWYVKGRVKKLRAELQDTLIEIASEHEKHRFEPLRKNFAELNGVSKFNLNRGAAILDNEKQMFISYHSLFFACKVCSEVNTSLLKNIENERYGGKSDGKELELLLKNAIIVYETTSLIIGMIQGFQLKGLNDFQTLRDTVFKELSEAESNSQRNVVQANNPVIPPSQREETILRHRNLMESAMYVRVQWQRFEDQIMSMQQNAAAIAQRLPSLALTRDNAKVQLDFLELVAVTQMMDQNIRAIEGLASLELTLAPLSPYDVCRLLGLETAPIGSNYPV
jgi:hypothetical protein